MIPGLQSNKRLCRTRWGTPRVAVAKWLTFAKLVAMTELGLGVVRVVNKHRQRYVG